MYIKEALTTGTPMLIFAFIWIFKPYWLLRLMVRPNASQTKIKIMTKVIQFIGIFAALFTIYAMINTIFFVK
jgi:hypothetical protein